MIGNPANQSPPAYAVRSLVIPAHGQVETARRSEFLSCLSAAAPFKMRLDSQPEVDFQAGLTIRPVEGFDRVTLRNETASDVSVILAFGKGAIQDSRLTLGGEIATSENMPDTLTTGAAVSALDAAATLLAAANANRREIILVNDGAGKLYIGGASGAAAGEGLPLPGGATLVLSTSAAVYARNDTGAAISVAVAEIERG